MSDANGHDNVTPLFPEPARRRPRVRKLRLLVVLVPVLLLAIVSTVFGMMYCPSTMARTFRSSGITG